MTAKEFNQFIESNPKYDNMVDDTIKEMGEKEENIIFDSRLAWFFVPKSFKIYMYVDVDTATERIFNDKGRVSESYSDMATAKKEIIERRQSEVLRYKNFYNADINNYKNYDFIIDTSHATKDEVNDLVLSSFRAFEQGEAYNRVWLSPKNLDLSKNACNEEDINTEDQKVALAVQKAIPQIEKLVSQIVPRMKQGGRIFYMGAGTSGRLGVLDASEIPPTFGMPPTLVIGLIAGGDTALRNPVENAEDDMQRGWEELLERNITDKDTVIGIAASGTTPYVIGAMHEAREHGILTGCITSNPDSPMAAEADVAIEMVVGPEYVTGSSRMKSGTGQKMILNMITTSVMIQLGRVKGNKMVNMQLSNKKLVDRGTRMIVEELGLDYGKAQALLLMHGSVKKAVDAYRGIETEE